MRTNKLLKNSSGMYVIVTKSGVIIDPSNTTVDHKCLKDTGMLLLWVGKCNDIEPIYQHKNLSKVLNYYKVHSMLD